MKEQRADTYYNVHSNYPAVVLGNGPSLELVRGYERNLNHDFITIGMNRSWKVYPNPNYHAIMFHYEHLQDLQDGKWVPTSGCTVWAFKHYCEMWLRDVDQGKVVYVPSVAEPDNDMHQYNLAGMLSCDLAEASFADMTGHFGLEIALYLGCDPIYLVGYDLYGGHFDDKLKPEDEWREVQVDLFEYSAKQIKDEFSQRVYNLSPDSVIEGFEKREIKDVIESSGR
jgi:hypothetical protein